MKPSSVRATYDLRPYLIASATKSFVIFPCSQNELELRQQITSLFSHFLPNLHVIALVEQSSDLESLIVRNIKDRFGNRVTFIQQQTRDSGVFMLLPAITYALDRGAKNVIQLSAFTQNEIGYLPDMLRFADQYDLIIGSRFLGYQEFICPQKQQQYKIDRWINGTLLRSFFSSKITDANGATRCWSRAALDLVVPRLRLRQPRLLNLEMTYLSHKHGLRMMEFPVAYKPTVRIQTPFINSSPYNN